MKYKVHWLIDGLIEVEAADTETAEKLIKENERKKFSRIGNVRS